MTEPIAGVDENSFREVAGNTPLPLDDPERLWLVVEGWVDVFVVSGRDGEPAGGRVHLFRAEVGQMMFGVGRGGGTAHLIGLGMVGSQVVAIERKQFRADLAAAPEPGQFSALVDGWVRGLTTGVARGLLPPRGVTPLEADMEAPFEAEDVVTPARGVLWVRPGLGDLCFLGEERLLLDGTGGLFPVSVPAWLEARRQTSLTGQPTQAVLNDGQLWTGLEQFHRVVLACTALNRQRLAAAERDRFRRRQQHDRQMIQAALGSLAAVARKDEVEAAPLGTETNALFAACRLVGAAQGIVMRPAQEASAVRRAGATVANLTWGAFQRMTLAALEHRRRSDAVLAIARASRVRTRRVLLAEDW